MNKQLLATINQICVEKNIPYEKVVEAIEAALRTAYRKDYANKKQNIKVLMDRTSGEFNVVLVKNVVESIEDEDNELLLKDAKKINKNAKIGDEIEIPVESAIFGRIAAQAAKQVILQRFQEIEREIIFETFKEREGEVVGANVSKVDGRNVFVEIEKNTLLLPYDEQVRRDSYYTGKRLQVYIKQVVKTRKGPEMIISRTAPELVKRLFEFEIPEIKQGLVEIKGVARSAGIRTKIAVATTDAKVDPIGACVGQKGVRIQSIIDEISGEMIDVIEWDPDPKAYLIKALSPAKISHIVLQHKDHRAKVYVEESQRPLAIGKQGQNVKLASDLTGWEIDILDLKDYQGEVDELVAEGEKAEPTKVMTGQWADLDLPASVIKKLEKAGINDVAVLVQMSEDDLTKIGGIGVETAKKIIAAVHS